MLEKSHCSIQPCVYEGVTMSEAGRFMEVNVEALTHGASGGGSQYKLQRE